MSAYQRSYKCHICNWQGMAEPYQPGDRAFCDNCGTMLYPCSGLATWGQATLIIALTLLAIFAWISF